MKTALDVVRAANESGLVGYAEGGANLDWPAVEAAIDAGYIVFERDASKSRYFGEIPQTRTLYRVTARGREAAA